MPGWHTSTTALVVETQTGRDTRVLVVLAAGSESGGVPQHEAWELPRWTVERRRNYEEAWRLVAEARDRLGMDVVLLRYLEVQDEEAERLHTGTVLLEAVVGAGMAGLPLGQPCQSSDPAQPGGSGGPVGARWVAREELRRLTAREPAQWALVEGVLQELKSGVAPPRRVPWAQPGWFAQASGWMADRLEGIGRRASGAVEQRRNWCLSCVLRAPTAAGNVYLKAPSAHFKNEARITLGLAERFPDDVPRVLAADEARSWLLLEDAGDVIRHADTTPDARLWEQALRRIGELQRACVGQAEWLLATGCADRRLARLREQVPGLLDAPETRAETDPAVLARLRARVLALQAACDELAACGVPETLIHGDLHPGNVAVKDGRLTIFDWTDAALGHPFLDLLTFLPDNPHPYDDHSRPRMSDPAAVASRLLDAYLKGWTAFAPLDELRRAVSLLETVARLHHAQSYLQIMQSVEPADRWQFHGDIARYLEELDGLG